MQVINVQYHGVTVNAYEVLYVLGIDFQIFQEISQKKPSCQEAFDLLISFHNSDPELLKSKLPAKDVILKYYLSINEFCIKHKIKNNAFSRLLNRNQSLSFGSILSKYLLCDEEYNYTFKNVYCGVSMEAICVEFQINYKEFSKFFDRSKPFEEQILFFYIMHLNIPKEVKADIAANISMLFEYQEKIVSLFFPKENIYSDVLHCCYELLDALNAYYIADYFKNGWLESYYRYMATLKKTSLNKTRLPLEKEAYRQFLFLKYNYSEEELKMLEAEFYSDYTLVQDVWIYKRVKII